MTMNFFSLFIVYNIGGGGFESDSPHAKFTETMKECGICKLHKIKYVNDYDFLFFFQ